MNTTSDEADIATVRRTQLIAVLQGRFIAEGMDDATALDEARKACARMEQNARRTVKGGVNPK